MFLWFPESDCIVIDHPQITIDDYEDVSFKK